MAPLLETSHYRYYHYLIFAKALELRGAEVRLILCGSVLDGCELKNVRSPRVDPCLNCRFNHAAVVPLFGFRTDRLADLVPGQTIEAIRVRARDVASNYPRRLDYLGLDLIPMTNDSVTRHFYGDTPAEGTEELRQARYRHLVSSMIGLEAARRVDQEWEPDIVLAYMSSYSAWAPYEMYFKERGKPVVNIASTQFDYRAVNVNMPDVFMSPDRYNRYKQSRATLSLTEDEYAVLDKVLQERFSGRARIFNNLGFFESEESVVKALDLDRSKRNVFLFSNIFWDVGLNERPGLFSNVIEWVLKTIELIKDQPDCRLYIKPHPGEKFDSAPSLKGVVDYVRLRYPALPANISFILPEMKIKPYDLAPFADLAVVYTGTLGLEMMLLDVPVIACGMAPYSGPGLAMVPTTPQEYRELLLGERAMAQPNAEAVSLFAYFYFIKFQIPWTLTPQVYADQFTGYSIHSLDQLLPGRDRYLDHLCDCVLNPNETVIEAW